MGAPFSSATFEEIAQVIGEAPARALCDHLGGTTLYVPAQIGPAHPVTAAIGAKAARELAEHFRGSHLQLPKAYLRRQRVLELRASTDMTIAQIALATDYTERHVHNILSASREDDGQLDLFRDLPKTTAA